MKVRFDWINEYQYRNFWIGASVSLPTDFEPSLTIQVGFGLWSLTMDFYRD